MTRKKPEKLTEQLLVVLRGSFLHQTSSAKRPDVYAKYMDSALIM